MAEVDFRVIVEMTLTYSFTVRAEDANEAMQSGMQMMPTRTAESVKTNIDVERGVQ